MNEPTLEAHLQSILRFPWRAFAPGLIALAAVHAAQAADAASAPAAAKPGTANLEAVAKSLVSAGLVTANDKVLISGGVRDEALLRNLYIETMKVGGQPLISLDSEKLWRRSYDEVPAQYDSQAPTLWLALVNTFDVQLSVDVGETENIMAGTSPERMAARAAAGQPVTDAVLKKGMRSVSLGNGLYPTAALAKTLGVPQAKLASVFWKATAVSPEAIRTKGESLRSTLAGAKEVTLTSPSGTHVTFGVMADKGFVSDGALTADKVKQGGAATATWLPAGELLVPVTPGSAEGKVVIDKFKYQGATIEGLVLNFSKGVLTSMNARSGLPALKAYQAYYDAATGGKDSFSYIDLGLNPEVTLPTNSGRVVWMAAGAVTIGVGDNTGWGGANVSTFSLAGPVSGATLQVDGQAVIAKGALH